MYAVVITDEGGAQRRLDFSKPELTVGRVNGNDIVLAKRNVSKQHARLTLADEKAVVVDLNSTNGTWVNGRKITAPHPLKSGDKIYIADFIITLEPGETEARQTNEPKSLSEPPPVPSNAPKPGRSSQSVRASMPVRSMPPNSSSSRARTSRPKDAAATGLPPRIESRPTDEADLSKSGPIDDPLRELMTRLSERIDIQDIRPASMKDQERWSAARAAIAETFLAMQNDGSVTNEVDMRQIAHTALHEIVGLGALDDVLSNESVQMAVVHGPNRVLIDTGAGPRSTKLSFSSNAALQTVAHRLAAQCGRLLGETQVFYGRLAFGPRVTILQPPLVATGPVIEIRIDQTASLEKLAEENWMSGDTATYLTKAVAECRNIVLVGTQDSGVTTLLSALTRELPQEENTVVIEASPELDVDRTEVIALTSDDAGLRLGEAVAHASRLRADHMVINDVGGSDVANVLSVVGSRAPGHLVAVHCSSTTNAIDGLLLAASCSGGNRACIAQLIGSTVHAVVAVQKGPDGSRVTAIHEVEGHEAGDVSFQSVPL